MEKKKEIKESAVSPVVGVMLMLVVTIIIAAVVSAFAGGLTSDTSKAPSLSVETKVVNIGSGSSYYRITVLSASQPIATKDLKIITSWTNSTGYKGGATVLPNSGNTYYVSYGSLKRTTSPLGYGAGVSEYINEGTGGYPPGQLFGNYTLVTGTIMHNFATGMLNGAYNSSWEKYSGWYTGSDAEQDGATAVLGPWWNTLKPGETINFKIIHIPSKKVIVDQNVIVEGN